MAKKEYKTEKAKNKYSKAHKNAQKEIKETKNNILIQESYNHYENKEIMVMKPVDCK